MRKRVKRKEPPGSLNSRCLGAPFLEEVVYCPLTCSHRDECGGKVTGISARPHDTLTQSKFSARENCPCHGAQCDPWARHSICTSRRSLSRRWNQGELSFLYTIRTLPLGPPRSKPWENGVSGLISRTWRISQILPGSGGWTQQLTSPGSPTLSRRDKTSTA